MYKMFTKYDKRSWRLQYGTALSEPLDVTAGAPGHQGGAAHNLESAHWVWSIWVTSIKVIPLTSTLDVLKIGRVRNCYTNMP